MLIAEYEMTAKMKIDTLLVNCRLNETTAIRCQDCAATCAARSIHLSAKNISCSSNTQQMPNLMTSFYTYVKHIAVALGS